MNKKIPANTDRSSKEIASAMIQKLNRYKTQLKAGANLSVAERRRMEELVQLLGK